MNLFLSSTNLLATVTEETVRSNQEACKIVEGLDGRQLNWSPGPGAWSIAQCLDHLAVTGSSYAPYFTAVLARHAASQVSHPIPYRPTWAGGWLIRQVVPESARKARAPRIFKPAESPEIHEALEKFLAAQERFSAFIRQANGLDYNRIRLRSPVTPLFRYSLADAFVVTVVHVQRHLQQARRVCQAPGFPR